MRDGFDMKKKIRIVTPVVLALMLVSSPALGTTYPEETIGSTDVNLEINGEAIQTDAAIGQPYITNSGRTMLPLRLVGETLNCDVTYDQGIVTVESEANNFSAVFQIYEKFFTVNGERIDIDTYVDVSDEGRAYVPIRALIETFGQVEWNNDTRTVNLVTENWQFEKDGSQGESGLLPSYSYQDLLNQAPVIVTGSVVDASTIQIVPVGGENPAAFTDYTVEVVNALRGSLNTGEKITVRVQGEQTSNSSGVGVEDSVQFSLDDEVLLFLYQPKMGGSYNTEGDYYYILGQSQGAYQADGSTYYSNVVGEAIDVADLQDDLFSMSSEQKQSAENINRFYEEFIANQQKNLENGFITRDEFDQMMKNIQEYATVVE